MRKSEKREIEKSGNQENRENGNGEKAYWEKRNWGKEWIGEKVEIVEFGEKAIQERGTLEKTIHWVEMGNLKAQT